MGLATAGTVLGRIGIKQEEIPPLLVGAYLGLHHPVVAYHLLQRYPQPATVQQAKGHVRLDELVKQLAGNILACMEQEEIDASTQGS